MGVTKVNDTKRVRCRNCKKVTNHCALFVEEKIETDEFLSEDVLSEHVLLKCLGCDTICLGIGSIWSTDIKSEDGEFEIPKNYYPNPYIVRERIDGILHVPKKVAAIYEETRNALNYKLPILATIGIGSVIEAICRDKGISGGNLENKIDKMAKKGIITLDGAKLLHIAREKRNASAHLIQPLGDRQIELCMNVIDSVLSNLYVLPGEFESFEVPF